MLRLSDVKPVMLAMLMTLAALGQRAEAAAEEVLTVAGGCFWCVEADFEKVKGVSEVVSGYTGGTTANPTYKQVTRGGTGHYEAVQIRFDPGVISRERLLELFFRSVDPTDAGGQFCDRGDSYRTAVFVQDAGERELAERIRSEAQSALGQEIVTPVLQAGDFWEAEAYHQDYYKSQERTLTRFGYVTRADAYEGYRDACKRDARVRSLWGDDAPFAGG